MADDALELYADDVEIIADNGVTRLIFSVEVFTPQGATITSTQRVVSRIALDQEAAKVLLKNLSVILP